MKPEEIMPVDPVKLKITDSATGESKISVMDKYGFIWGYTFDGRYCRASHVDAKTKANVRSTARGRWKSSGKWYERID